MAATDSISCDYIRKNGSYSSEHTHPTYELSIIVSGKLNITNNSSHVELDAPCVVFHFPGTFHSIAASPGTPYERYNIYFSPEVFKGNQPLLDRAERLYRSHLSVLAIDSDTLEELLYYIRPFMRAKHEPQRQILLLTLILDLLDSCQRIGFFPESRSGTLYINGVVRYISEKLSPSLSADEIAEKFEISRAKLTADFKRETGMTLKEYISLACIDRARILLSTGSDVTRTALEVGYQSAGAFIRAFKKLTGTTPGAYSDFCTQSSKPEHEP